MSIARYENATINAVTNGTDAFGQYTTTITPLFTSRAIVIETALEFLSVTVRIKIW